MQVRINGQETNLAAETNLLALLEQKGINPATVVVEYNCAIPPRQGWAELWLKAGDNIEIVKFMGGG